MHSSIHTQAATSAPVLAQRPRVHAGYKNPLNRVLDREDDLRQLTQESINSFGSQDFVIDANAQREMQQQISVQMTNVMNGYRGLGVSHHAYDGLRRRAARIGAVNHLIEEEVRAVNEVEREEKVVKFEKMSKETATTVVGALLDDYEWSVPHDAAFEKERQRMRRLCGLYNKAYSHIENPDMDPVLPELEAATQISSAQ